MRVLALAFCLGLCASLATAQTLTRVTSGPGGGTAHFEATPHAYTNVPGQPYSGKETNEVVKTLADGTQITRRQSPVQVYRDSLGRTRSEMPIVRALAQGGVPSNSPVLVEIVDPVAQVRYTLDTSAKVAHRHHFSDVVRKGPITGSQQEPVPTTREDLGTQTIEGVLAQGTRITRAYPVGFMGNDRPLSVVDESWVSPELKIFMMSRPSDPRTGDISSSVRNVSRSEPSSALFQVPSDYSIVDDPRGFDISWSSR